MGLYRKKPVVIEAYRHAGPEPLAIDTLEGVMTASPGDWIITGVQGERYPCKPDIFEQTYEPASDECPRCGRTAVGVNQVYVATRGACGNCLAATGQPVWNPSP